MLCKRSRNFEDVFDSFKKLRLGNECFAEDPRPLSLCGKRKREETYETRTISKKNPDNVHPFNNTYHNVFSVELSKNNEDVPHIVISEICEISNLVSECISDSHETPYLVISDIGQETMNKAKRPVIYASIELMAGIMGGPDPRNWYATDIQKVFKGWTIRKKYKEKRFNRILSVCI